MNASLILTPIKAEVLLFAEKDNYDPWRQSSFPFKTIKNRRKPD